MIAMPLTCPDISREQTSRHSPAATAQDGRPAGILPGGGAPVSAPFAPLDPGIVNAAIPAFFIGRNSDGFWLARDVKGKTGGIFLFERSALSFARRHSRPLGCATIFPSERFELDLENQGSALVAPLRHLMRLTAHIRQRATVVIAAIKRRFAAI